MANMNVTYADMQTEATGLRNGQQEIVTQLNALRNRITNLVVAAVLVPYTLFNVAGESLEWAAFYAVSIGVEIVLLLFVVRSAWKWKVPTATPVEAQI